ncbi:hypothetical protein [Natrialba sp. INN-245]|uniref:hypothetical protein n=1 Tax=Natrialba sp. INN-245 TaxID=2690967 RepID=UPI001312C52F|nr:hypothetical protein [Natrialba sp. INN-245]MWV40458.1 hypothetical protein [Natrialba sp. INN-245]
MPSRTRRRTLQAAAGTLAVLAGCSERDRSDPSSADEPDEEIDVIDGVDVQTVGFEPTDEDVVAYEDGSSSRLPYVTDEEDVDALEFRAEPLEVDGSASIERGGNASSETNANGSSEPDENTSNEPGGDPDDPLSFLRGIDYEESTGLLVQEEVSACYRNALQYVEHRNGDGVRVQFCQAKRDPDVECSVDDRRMQVTMIEVPIA